MTSPTYRLRLTPSARRTLAEGLPSSVAAAIMEFVTGPLLSAPRRIGKPLGPPFTDQLVARRGEYRLLYRMDESRGLVVVVAISHRRDAYRRR